VKPLVIAAVAGVALTASVGTALAQYGDVVPIRPNYRGEPSCPSNYVVRGNACVSIYGERGGYEGRGYRHNRDYGYRDGYGGGAVQPRMNYRGEPQCPSNYIIRRGVCVSIYR
jgi:hypothetical protein